MSTAETKRKTQYSVRRVHLGRTAQLDALAHACGQVYSGTLLFFWRTVRHKGLWLKPKHLMRLIASDPDQLLHSHTVDATVQAFFAGLASWRERRKTDPSARPPRHRKWYFRIEYKSSAIALKDSLLILSNGWGKAPLVLFWEWNLPHTVVIHWTGSQYEALATYQTGKGLPEGVEKLVIGDVRTIRHGLDKGSKTNQKLHQWSFGSMRHKLTYKAERLGMRVVVQEESFTSRTCPVCGHRRKSAPAGRAGGRGTAMAWEPQTSAPSIVANLVGAT